MTALVGFICAGLVSGDKSAADAYQYAFYGALGLCLVQMIFWMVFTSCSKKR